MARGKNSAKTTGTQAQTQPAMQPETGGPGVSGNGSAIEQQVVAFAEQLGRVVGTVQARAEGWLDPRMLNEQITRVRDGAASLLQQLGATTEAKAERVITRRPAARSGGVVDAPGKKHRKPTPNEPLRANAEDKGRIAKMKAVNASRRRGRG